MNKEEIDNPNPEILNELIEFVEFDFGIARKRMNRNSRIVEDLRIVGADGIELIVKFSKRFNVDVSEFLGAKYFGAEGMNWLIPSAKEGILTLGNLERAIMIGRLNEDVINNRGKTG